jgi:hypothetical protein
LGCTRASNFARAPGSASTPSRDPSMRSAGLPRLPPNGSGRARNRVR